MTLVWLILLIPWAAMVWLCFRRHSSRLVEAVPASFLWPSVTRQDSSTLRGLPPLWMLMALLGTLLAIVSLATPRIFTDFWRPVDKVHVIVVRDGRLSEQDIELSLTQIADAARIQSTANIGSFSDLQEAYRGLRVRARLPVVVLGHQSPGERNPQTKLAQLIEFVPRPTIKWQINHVLIQDGTLWLDLTSDTTIEAASIELSIFDRKSRHSLTLTSIRAGRHTYTIAPGPGVDLQNVHMLTLFMPEGSRFARSINRRIRSIEPHAGIKLGWGVDDQRDLRQLVDRYNAGQTQDPKGAFGPVPISAQWSPSSPHIFLFPCKSDEVTGDFDSRLPFSDLMAFVTKARINPAPRDWQPLARFAGQTVIARNDGQIWIGIDSPELRRSPAWVAMMTWAFDQATNAPRRLESDHLEQSTDDWRNINRIDAREFASSSESSEGVMVVSSSSQLKSLLAADNARWTSPPIFVAAGVALLIALGLCMLRC